MAENERVPAYVLWFGPTGLSIARALGRHGIPVVALHDEIEEPCTASRYARVKILPRLHEDEGAWLDFLLEEGRRIAPRRGVIFAAADAPWSLLARHRAALEPYFHLLLPAGPDSLAYLLKPFQYAAAERAGVPYPRTLLSSSAREVMAAVPTLQFPCLVKPVLSHLWVRLYALKLSIVSNPAELLEVCTRADDAGLEYMVQEFIPARDDHVFGVYAYADKAGSIKASCVVRKVRQFEPCFGSSCCSRSVDEPRVEALARRLVSEIRFHGICSTEFKLDPRDGQFKLMELNVRSPLMLAAATDSGVNLPLIAYSDVTGEPSPATARRRLGKRVGLIATDLYSAKFYRTVGELSAWRWALSWLRTRELHFAWDDMAPMRGCIRSLVSRWRRGKYRELPAGFLTPEQWRAQWSAASTSTPLPTSAETTRRGSLPQPAASRT